MESQQQTNLASSSDRASGSTSSIVRILAGVMLRIFCGSVETRTDVGPSTVVHGFLLTPNQVGIGIFIQMGCDLIIVS